MYQGHHGDSGAQLADVVLPGAAYVEKAGTYLNTEARAQVTRPAVSLPGAAREDWKIIRAASEFLGAPLPYDDVRAAAGPHGGGEPALRRYDLVEGTSVGVAGLGRVQLVEANKGAKSAGKPFRRAIEDFYFTDVISRR